MGLKDILYHTEGFDDLTFSKCSSTTHTNRRIIVINRSIQWSGKYGNSKYSLVLQKVNM